MQKKKLDLDKFKIKLHEGSSIKNVIAVMSGKGGVGKSSISALLASRLNKKGYKVAVFDADITGPSMAEAFGIDESVRGSKEGIMEPAITKGGIKLISVNMILPNKTDPVVWRSSIVTTVVKQFFTDVNWGEIDYMIVDMPPGTADVPLTVFQSLPIDGVVAVATPQGLVEMVATKSIKMARMMGKKIVGMVENMSYFKCPDCGSKHEIFGKSNLEKVCEQFDIDTLVKLPINPQIAEKTDLGRVEDIEMDDLDQIIEKIIKL